VKEKRPTFLKGVVDALFPSRVEEAGTGFNSFLGMEGKCHHRSSWKKGYFFL